MWRGLFGYGGFLMHPLTEMIYKDMRPALGVTEPGAIAFAMAKARTYATGPLVQADISMNSGLYKNAFTCGIPHSEEVGPAFSAALGWTAGKWDKGLEALSDVTEKDVIQAKRLIQEGRIHIFLSAIDPKIFIEVRVITEQSECILTICDSHTNIIRIQVDDKVLFEAAQDQSSDAVDPATVNITQYTLGQLLEYCRTVSTEELEFIQDAYKINIALCKEGLTNPRTTFARHLLERNHGVLISDDLRNTAQLLCNAAIEARVLGLDKPAMSITGSGAHGIIATLPLYAAYKVWALSWDELLRATALSYLICMYIKEHSGRLSAFCGCAIAAGTGAACALAFLRNAGEEQLSLVIRNMASGITGMICDGGNQGCIMKGITAVDAACEAAELAMAGICVSSVHGINGETPEQTMRQMGLIASPGMVGTEKTIMDILQRKMAREI